MLLATKLQVYKPVKSIIFAVGFGVITQGALAQQVYTPPLLPNKDVDDYSVEVKSSRYNAMSPEVVAIGDGDARLSIRFSANDRSSTFWQPYGGTVSSIGSSNPLEVRYGDSTETFVGSGTTSAQSAVIDYVPQISSGSTLRRTYNGSTYQFIFTDKSGVRYESAPDTNATSSKIFNKIVSPSGLEIYINGSSIRNNRGYQIKINIDPNNGLYWQAVNNAIDYCSDIDDKLCNIANSRVGRTYNTSEYDTLDRVFQTPTGERTIFRYKPIAVATYPNTTKYIYLPTFVDLPAPGLNEISIEYNIPNASNLEDDIQVKRVSSIAATVDYSYVKDIINTGGYTSRGYNLQTIAYISAVRQYTALSVTPPMSAGSAKRVPSTMLTWTDAAGNKTSYSSDKFGRLSGSLLPNGAFTSQSSDDRNNYTDSTLGGKDLPNITTKRSFPTTCSDDSRAYCNLPTSVTDPNGTATTYEYNARGQLTSVFTPSPTAGGTSSKTAYAYSLRYAYIKNASGGLVAAGSPISLLDSSSTCASQLSCSGTSDEIRTKYDYGPTTGLNNLQLKGIGVSARGADGTFSTRWTCFTYNYFGERISESRPNRMVVACP